MFMKDSGSIRNNLEICPSEGNEGPVMMVVDEYFKSVLFDVGEHSIDGNKQVGSDRIAIEEAREGPVNGDVIIEGFGEE